MNFAFSDEQEELRRSVRRFLEDRSPETEVRRLMGSDPGYDPEVWRQLSGQLGLTGLAVPESHGGSGYGWVELSVVFEEMGRALLCAPYFATVAMAAPLLTASADERAMADYLPGIAEGSTIATVALAEQTARWEPDAVTLTATNGDAGWELTGEKCFVLDGHVADLVLVVARVADGLGIFAVERGATGFDAVGVPTLDQTRTLARCRFDATPARAVAEGRDATAAVVHMLDLVSVALACEQVGGAQRVLDMTVGYAKDRVQFGRPIGSFQAIKHMCADTLLEVESARSAAYYAAWAAADGSDELPVVATLAKAYCSEAYFHAAAQAIQIHGGIGFTWDHPAHLYFKRAKSSELLFGDPTYHRELLAQRIGI